MMEALKIRVSVSIGDTLGMPRGEQFGAFDNYLLAIKPPNFRTNSCISLAANGLTNPELAFGDHGSRGGGVPDRRTCRPKDAGPNAVQLDKFKEPRQTAGLIATLGANTSWQSASVVPPSSVSV